MALATTDDVEAALERTMTEGETARAEQLLDTASAYVIEQAGGYRFEPGTHTITRRVRNGRVKLPGQAASVASVKWIDRCDGTTSEASGWNLYRNTIYGLTVWATQDRFAVSGAPDWVEVSFVSSAQVPDEIVALVATMVAATIDSPSANVAAETVGPFQRSFVASSGRVFLSTADKAIIGKYRRGGRAIELL